MDFLDSFLGILAPSAPVRVILELCSDLLGFRVPIDMFRGFVSFVRIVVSTKLCPLRMWSETSSN